MPDFNESFLRYICSDKWTARCYGEYLTHCAESAAKLLDVISQLVNDSSLNTYVDSKTDVFMDAQQSVMNEIYSTLADQGLVESIESFDWNDQNILAAFDSLYQSNDDFKTACDSVAAEFPSEHVSGDEAYRLFSDNLDNIIARDATYNTQLMNRVDTLLNSINFPQNGEISLNEGFGSARVIIAETVKRQTLCTDGDEFSVSLHNLNAGSHSVTLTSDEVVNQFKSSFASTIAWASGFTALSQDSVSDIVADYSARVSTYLQDQSQEFSTAINEVKTLLTSVKGNVTNFLTNASHLLGMDKVNDNTFTNINETPVSEYTGASPFFAMGFHVSLNVFESIASTFVTTMKWVWNNVVSIVSNGWNKVKTAVEETVFTPNDIEVINDKDDSYTVDKWAMKIKFNNCGISYNNETHDSSFISAISILGRKCYYGDMQSYTLDTMLGTIIVNYDRVAPLYTGGGPGAGINGYECDGSIIFKPKCLNFQSLVDYGIVYISDQGRTSEHVSFLPVSLYWEKYRKWIDSGLVYANDGDSEKDKFMGFLSASKLLLLIMSASIQDLDSRSGLNMRPLNVFQEDEDPAQPAYGDNNWIEMSLSGIDWRVGTYSTGRNGLYPLIVGNDDFIQVTSGYISYQDTWTPEITSWNAIYCGKAPENQGDPYTNGYQISVSTFAALFLGMLAYQQYSQQNNPLDYMFLPYSHESFQFSEGRYRIKTDAQNIDKANKFLAIAIGVYVVVVLTIVVKTLSIIHKRAKFAKLASRVGVMDNAMWNGKKLSPKETRKYIRAQRKLNKMDILGSGLAGAPSTASTIGSTVANVAASAINSSDVDLIKSLAKGTIADKTTSDLSQLILLIRGN